MWPYLVTFTELIFNGKLHFFCAVKLNRIGHFDVLRCRRTIRNHIVKAIKKSSSKKCNYKLIPVNTIKLLYDRGCIEKNVRANYL